MQPALLGVRRALCSSRRILCHRHLGSWAELKNEVHSRKFKEENGLDDGIKGENAVKTGKFSKRDGGNAKQDSEGTKDNTFVPARIGPVDGNAYAYWGKVKWRPAKEDKPYEPVEEVYIRKRNNNKPPKERKAYGKAGKTPQSGKSSEKPVKEKTGQKKLKGGKNGKIQQPGKTHWRDAHVEKGESKADLLRHAMKSIQVEQTEVKSADIPPGWNTCYRNKVEEALVEKGLIQDADKQTYTAQALSSSEEDEEVSDGQTLGASDEDEGVSGTDEAESDDDNEEEYSGNAVTSNEEEDGSDKEGEDESDDDEVESFHQKQQEKRSASETEASQDVKKRREKRAATSQARALIQAIDADEPGGIPEQHQKLLRTAIVGAPNAGKSCLLNYLIGTKVSAVSRKTNTTRNEILGILTEGDTQILFYDTPGLMVDWKGQALRQDTRNRVQSAWMVTNHCDVLIVLVDAHRQIDRPDQRVKRLIDKIGAKRHPTQKRVLCLNKVDLIRNKRTLVPLAQELGGLPGFESVFMISGLRGGGVRHLKEYLTEQAVFCPWEEEQGVVTDMNPVMIAKEVVWEHVLDNLHQEIPYELQHKHISWKVLSDQSIRIEQQLVVQTDNQKRILIGKKGALIRKIGMAANEELCARLGRKIHLMLDVKIASGHNTYAVVEDIPDEMWM